MPPLLFCSSHPLLFSFPGPPAVPGHRRGLPGEGQALLPADRRLGRGRVGPGHQPAAAAGQGGGHERQKQRGGGGGRHRQRKGRRKLE